MSIAIAEYLGSRTDVETSRIIPSVRGGVPVPICPFSGSACIKLGHNPPLQPICSVRVYDRQYNGTPFIVCSNRLIPAQAQTFITSHTDALASIAETVFPGVDAANVGLKRQVGISLKPGRLILDYVLHVDPAVGFTAGPDRVIVEVQGGGETSNTGTITRYVDDWIAQRPRTNAFLAQKLDTGYLRSHLGVSKVNVPGIIPNNAWKRQLEQILKKAVLARDFGGAFALVCGEILHDYIMRSVPSNKEYFSAWQVALIGISEVPSAHPGAIPITQVSRAVYMTFSEFVMALENFTLPADLPDPFHGNYQTLMRETFTMP